ncbi:helix-turn-helix domain-containing protein [Allopontixanthobacter sediminis]|uniref:Helix-turn-helix domain-containing protein n=1 Tax=Allopontixanthobacter sediminis TaxID=1689985 RepID=A0A845B367_9SPHN|nr:helix-turn-helix domain-containing protein [Allopontixanthobacter sediminis]MXP44840.1 hypothetical protein [Allopontixanthobacter sediminis]
MTRRYDPRRALPHLSYTREQLAGTFKVTLTTIWSWTKKGLHPIDRKRPYLFAGGDVRKFLQAHNKPRQPTGPGQIYCVACKQVTQPAGKVVDFIALSPTNGDLVGRCPNCSRRIFQRVRTADIATKAGSLTVRYEGDVATINTDAEPSRTEPLNEGGV